nr:hypothetical protein K-LCC10_0342 [Kaumoebavirus]
MSHYLMPDNFDELLDSFMSDLPEIQTKPPRRRFVNYGGPRLKDIASLRREPRREVAYKYLNIHIKVPIETISTARSKFEVVDCYLEIALTQAELGLDNMFSDFRDFFVSASLSDNAALIMKFVDFFYRTISDNLDMLLTLLAKQPHHTLRSKPCLLVTYLASIFSTYEPGTTKSFSCTQIQKMFSAGFANNVLAGSFHYQIRDGEIRINPRLSLILVTANVRIKEPNGIKLFSIRFFNQTANVADEAKSRIQSYIDHENLDQTFELTSIKSKTVVLADMVEFTPGAIFNVATI